MERLQTQWPLMSEFGFWKLDSQTALSCHQDEEVGACGMASLRGTPVYLDKAIMKKKKGNPCLGVSKIESL